MSVLDQSYTQIRYSPEASLAIQKRNYGDEKTFALKPLNSEKESEMGCGVRDISLLNDDRTLRFSPEYRAEDNYGVDANMSNDKFEIRQSENLDATFTSRNFKPLTLDSPKSLFRFLSDGLKSKTIFKPNFGRLNDTGDFPTELLLKTENGWEVGTEEARRGGFRLNPIYIDEHIMVPEIANNRERQPMRSLDLGSSAQSEKSTKKDI